MTSISPRTSRPWAAIAWALALCLTQAACNDSNVVAVVGKTQLTRADLERFASTRSGMAPNAEALDALIARQLLAEEGRRDDVLDDPQVRAEWMAAQREILAQAVLERRLATATTEAELRKRYQADPSKLSRRQVHVAQIAVNVSPAASPEERRGAEAKINTVYARLVGGDSFEALAEKASDDRVSAARGGDVGVLREGQVDPAFFDAAAALKHGEVSKPFQTAFGFHVVKALEDPSVFTPPFEEVRGKLAADARRELEASFVAKLKSDIRIKRYPEHLSAAPRAEALTRGKGER